MAIDTTADDPPRDALALPRRNPVPLIVAGAVALALAVGVMILALSGDDEPDSQPFTLGQDEAPESDLELGAPVPEVTFEYFDGRAGGFDDFRGRPVVLNFFAEWCTPCVEEMPGLQEVSEEYGESVQFLGLDVNDPVEKGQEIVELTGIEYTVARDPAGDIAAAFLVHNMPTTVFIDADGNVVRAWTGQIEPDELRQIIERDLLPA
jgi:thiol-disulfide isomerase/thioredoxin